MDRHEAEAAGFTSHMPKPVDFEALQEMLASLENACPGGHGGGLSGSTHDEEHIS
jgi:hypothetical protein